MHSTTADLPADVDISSVPPQPAVISYRCPTRVALDLDESRAHLKAPRDPEEASRHELTLQFVDEIRTVLATTAVPDASVVVIDRNDPDGEAATRRAIAGDARLIIGARLPTDPVGHRRGSNAVLVRAGRAHGFGWYPVEIRRHLFTREASGTSVSASPITEPFPDAAVVVEGTAIRTNRHNENGRQLAHQWHLLRAMGALVPGQRAMGGVIDRPHDRVWWVDLEDPRWPTRWTDRKVTMLEHYDHGFDFRLRNIAHQAGRDEPLMERAVPPVRIGECATCPWEALCMEAMESVDHVSLLPRSTFDQYRAHKDRGVSTRAQVAHLDWPTGYAMHGPKPSSTSVDLLALVDITRDLSADTSLEDVLRPPPTNPQVTSDPAPVQLQLLGMGSEVADADPEPDDPDEAAVDVAGSPVGSETIDCVPGNHLVPFERIDHVTKRFAEIGINTVADLSILDPLTASYSGQPCGHLPTVIDQARAAVAGRPFLARGLNRADPPRADVEIDVDMENVEDGVYLWGTFVSGSEANLERVGLRRGYRAFWDLGPMEPTSQVEVFSRFWTWLTSAREACDAADLSFKAYCYTSAEHQKMVQILAAAGSGSTVPLPTPGDITDFVRSPQWVDMYDVVRNSLVVGHGLGLKRVAPLAGFHWRDEDAGGLQSMAWHREAMENPDPTVRAHNRARLLTYNEDDVRATLAVREWLSTASIASIDDWEPTRAADA